MSPNNNFNILAWYDSIDQQNHRKSYMYGSIWGLIAPDNSILPFQFVSPGSLGNVTSIVVKSLNSNKSIDLTGKLDIQVTNHTDDNNAYSIVMHKGNSTISPKLSEGRHYIVLKQGTKTWYSEVFTVVSNISCYIKLEYWDNDNLYFKGGHIDYTSGFKFVCYLSTKIGKPSYPFEEELTERDGYKFIEKQTSSKVYNMTFNAPEFMCDALRLVRMCDNINITSDGKVYRALSFSVNVDWEDYGDVAAVDAEFETDTVVTKIANILNGPSESGTTFNNALLYEKSSPLMFGKDVIAQYTRTVQVSVQAEFAGKLIRELNEYVNDALPEVGYLALDLGYGEAMKLSINKLADRYWNYVDTDPDNSYLIPKNAKHILSIGDIVAYATSDHDIVLPHAGYNMLGAVMIKEDSGLIIDSATGLLSLDPNFGGKGKIYYAGAGLQLLTQPNTEETQNQFAVKFGNAKGTVLEGDKLYAATWWGQKLNSNGIATGAMTDVPSINGLIHLNNDKTFDVAKDKSAQWVRFSGGNSINGMTGTNAVLSNLYLNYKDTSHYVKVDANDNVLATGDVVAYAAGNYDIVSPIAGTGALGMVKVGNGLNIATDGTLSVAGDVGGSVSGITKTGTGNALTDVELTNDNKIITFTKGLTFWHKDNDGSGSGLDADMVDGYHRSNLYNTTLDWFNSSTYRSREITVTNDYNTFYPVVLKVAVSTNGVPYTIGVGKSLGSTSNPNWDGNDSTKTSSINYVGIGRIGLWDGNGNFFITLCNLQPYARLLKKVEVRTNDKPIIVFWLRGGTATYRIYCSAGINSINTYYARTNVGSTSAGLEYYVEPIALSKSDNNGNYAKDSHITASIFEGSLIGNANTATKLMTARTIWGQSFDGTQNVKGDMSDVGNLIMNNHKTFYIKDTSGANISTVTLNSQNGFYLGYGVAEKNYSSCLEGNIILFRTTASHTERMRISADGNVGIGTTSPVDRLEVVGAITANDIYPRSNNSYSVGYSSRRFSNGYFTQGVYVGEANTSANSNSSNTYIGKGYLELNATAPYIDFHHGNSAADYTSRLITTSSDTLNCTSNFTSSKNIRATGDVVAYATGSGDIVLPIAGTNSLGAVKIGSGISISADGTISVSGTGTIGGISVTGNGNVLTNATLSSDKKIITFTKGLTFWHKDNDGSGSGLDADMVDGYHRSNLYNTTLDWFNSSTYRSREITVTNDYNTFYPVVLKVAVSTNGVPYTIGVGKSLGSTSNPNWDGNDSTKTSSINYVGIGRIGLWDGNGNFFITLCNLQPYARLLKKVEVRTNDKPIIVFWLRGGTATYRIYCSAGINSINTYYARTNVGSTSAGLEYYVEPIALSKSDNNGNYAKDSHITASIFEGSLIGNANTATKLMTARTIWGQSFDGTQNVKGDMSDVGNLIMNNHKTFYIKDTSGANISTVTLNSQNGFYLGYGVAEKNYSSCLEGNIILFRTTASHTERMRISADGNVGIGTTSPVDRLEVVGAITANDIYPRSNNSYSVGYSSRRFSNGYFTQGVYVGEANTSANSNSSNTYIGKGYLELNATAPYIDFHHGNSAADYTSRLITTSSDTLNCTSNFTSSKNIRATGDVVAYATGNAPAPFKYWYPSVDTSGNLSWTNSTSTTTPTTRNIRGPQGPAGPSFNGGNITNILSIRNSGYPTLELYQNTSVYWRICVNTSNNTFCFKKWDTIVSYINGAGDYVKNSDMRLKNRISTVKDVLDRIMRLDVFRYTLKYDPDKTVSIGLSAQQVNNEFPEIVSNDGDYLGIYYGQIGPIAIQGIKELYRNMIDVDRFVRSTKSWMTDKDKRIADLEEEVKELREELNNLKAA